MPSLRILADENIPLVADIFGSLGEVTSLPASRISRENVRDADVLLVRSVKRVDARLLEGSRIRFVGSATIGTDHIETEYLHQRGIGFAHAPGSNADSVVEYVLAAILRIAVRRNRSLEGHTAGIIGCGTIGSRLADRLLALGVAVLKNDPPLAEAAEREGRRHDYRALEELLETADILTLHVPLSRTGKHPTEHLLDADRLALLKDGAWLINTSRGAVVDNRALGEMLRRRAPLDAVLDVWEQEPNPPRELIERVAIGTPHVAGYSYDGKVAGSLMLFEALAEHLGTATPDVSIPAPPPPLLSSPDPRLPTTDWLHHLVRQMYDIGADDVRMRRLAALEPGERAEAFAALRRDYPIRRAFGAHRLMKWLVPRAYQQAVMHGLAVPLQERSAGHTAQRAARLGTPPDERPV